MTILILIGVIFLIVGIATIIDKDDSIKAYIAIISITIAFVCFYEYGLKTNPQAIDVYRNRTTLEITYKDSIPVDSVVVFKDK